jgi:predicted dehydrogenase
MSEAADGRELRVGLCGLGEIGQFHLKAIEESDVALLAAVCELDRELADRSVDPGTAIYSDFDAMLADEQLDVVDICLPHHLHTPFASKALDAGCDVILEKPMSVDLAGCDEIVRAARASGRRVAVSHNQLFFLPHRRLLKLLRDGSLGELQSLYERLWIGGKYGGWREDTAKVGGGLLMDAGVHRVYMALAIGGPVRSVEAIMDDPRSEDSFSLLLEFDRGAKGVIQGSYHGPEGVFDDRIEIQASDGMAEVLGCEAFFEGDLEGEVQLRARIDGKWTDQEVTGSWDRSVVDSVLSILSAFSKDEEAEVDATAGRDAVALVEAAYRSAERGQRVALTEVTDAGEAA